MLGLKLIHVSKRDTRAVDKIRRDYCILGWVCTQIWQMFVPPVIKYPTCIITFSVIGNIKCLDETAVCFIIQDSTHPKNIHFFVFFYNLVLDDFTHISGLLHWHWGNHMIAPVPVKQPWRILIYDQYLIRWWFVIWQHYKNKEALCNTFLVLQFMCVVVINHQNVFKNLIIIIFHRGIHVTERHSPSDYAVWLLWH